MNDAVELRMPDIGDFDAVEMIEVPIKVGDQIEIDQPLIILESDKASMEISSEIKGTIKTLSVNVGDKVSQGDLIGFVTIEDISGEDKKEINFTFLSGDSVAMEESKSDKIELLVAIPQTKVESRSVETTGPVADSYITCPLARRLDIWHVNWVST